MKKTVLRSHIYFIPTAALGPTRWFKQCHNCGAAFTVTVPPMTQYARGFPPVLPTSGMGAAPTLLQPLNSQKGLPSTPANIQPADDQSIKWWGWLSVAGAIAIVLTGLVPSGSIVISAILAVIATMLCMLFLVGTKLAEKQKLVACCCSAGAGWLLALTITISMIMFSRSTQTATAASTGTGSPAAMAMSNSATKNPGGNTLVDTDQVITPGDPSADPSAEKSKVKPADSSGYLPATQPVAQSPFPPVAQLTPPRQPARPQVVQPKPPQFTPPRPQQPFPRTSRVTLRPSQPTEIIGSAIGNTVQRTVSNEPIVGFRWTTATGAPGEKDATAVAVRNIDPLAAPPFDHSTKTNNKVTTGYCMAREGYVVGGINVDADTDVHAFQVIFMRYKDGKIDTTDQYSSDWIGSPTGNATKQLAGDGKFVVGVASRKKNFFLVALGLMVAEAPATAPAPAAQ